MKRKKKKKIGVGRAIGSVFAVLGTSLGMVIIGLYAIMLVVTHGPSTVARDYFVLSVRESSAGGFLANMCVSKSTIKEIEENNKVADMDGVSDSSLITIDTDDDTDDDSTVFDTIEKENPDLVPYLVEDGIGFYDVSGSTYQGTMVVVEDPARVFVGSSGDYTGEAGMSVPDICEKYGATLAINAGGFEDDGGVGDGGTPLGFVFSEGVYKFGSLTESYNLIGFDSNNVFVIGSMTGQEAIDRGIRDAVSFSPFLILDGSPLEVTGLGGGLNPRTAIGQRSDGAVLMLIIEGRQASSLGASMNDLINEMLSFGAVNAANLDGGGSTVLYYKGEVKNTVASIYGTRGVPTAICVR